MQPVPKVMQFVWVGGPIPDKYIANIQKWSAQNPDYTVNLWIDTAATDPSKVVDAVKKAHIPGVVVKDLNGDAKRLLDHAPTKTFYQDEVTGLHANYAAACDLIRLEILDVEGGVYIDVDTLPNPDEPLGTIGVSEEIGFVKPPGPTNDVLAAIPHSRFVEKVRDKAIENYKRAYFLERDEKTAENLDLHRSKRPWKLRTETTLEWAGPDAYLTVYNKLLTECASLDDQLKLTEQVMPRSLTKKFITESDQNWRDKGPKNIQEANQYIKEELSFRLKNHCINELDAMITQLREAAPNGRITAALENLRDRLQRSSEALPIGDIFSSWKEKLAGEKIPNEVLELERIAVGIANHLGASQLSQPQIDSLKQNLFPKEIYTISADGGEELNKGFARKNMPIREVSDLFFSIVPPPPARTLTSRVMSFLSDVIGIFRTERVAPASTQEQETLPAADGSSGTRGSSTAMLLTKMLPEQASAASDPPVEAEPAVQTAQKSEPAKVVADAKKDAAKDLVPPSSSMHP